MLGLEGAPFSTSIAIGARQSAQAKGVDLHVQGPAAFDVTLQRPLLSAIIARRPDALLMAPCDRDGLTPQLQAAHEQGIAIPTIDTFIGNGDYVRGPVTFPLSSIGSDNRAGGQAKG